MNKMRREQSAALETALQDGIKKQLAIDTQTFEFKAEIERLKGQTRELQQESADKEVRIVQITKQRAQDKQDLEGLNIALDSKQQELELVSFLALSDLSVKLHVIALA
jgi:chromosome segregation ATPase